MATRSRKFYLGVDFGGSGLKGLLASTDGDVVRSVRGKAANFSVIGADNFVRALGDSVRTVLQGEATSAVARTVIAAAGAGRAPEKATIAELAGGLGLRPVRVLSDDELAHYAAFGDSDGVLLAAGTGSFCRIKKGDHSQRFGGWGYLLGDEGSGFALGREAIRNALGEWERGEELSHLTQAVLDLYGLKLPEQLISKIYAADNVQEAVAASAVRVCMLAADGDSRAQFLVDRCANQLVELLLTAVEIEEMSLPIPLAFSGSLLQPSSPVVATVLQRIDALCLDFDLKNPELPPVAAAVVLAAVEETGTCGDALSGTLKKFVASHDEI